MSSLLFFLKDLHLAEVKTGFVLSHVMHSGSYTLVRLRAGWGELDVLLTYHERGQLHICFS